MTTAKESFVCFERDDMDRSRFINVISQLMFRQVEGGNKKARLLVQFPSNVCGYNYSTVECDVNIDTWEWEEHKGHQVLIINRKNYNEGLRIDLDIDGANKARVTSDNDGQCIQVGSAGIWFDEIVNLDNL